MGEVLQFRTLPKRNLTNGDLYRYEQRVETISDLIDLCDPVHDADVIANLETELVQIIAILEAS